MSKKTNTIKISGNADYAKVSARLKEFREECPHGLIETTPAIQADGSIIFKARILKKKGDEASPEAVAHAHGKNSGQKAFEKLETIAVGRALAFLGYGADGEIASSEEMEEFYASKEEAMQKNVEAYTDKLNLTKNLKDLQELWAQMPPEVKVELDELKNTLKLKHESK